MDELHGLKNEGGRIGHIVLRESDEMNFGPHFAIEAIEILEQKGLRQLSRAIGAEVEKQNRIAIPHALLIRIRKNKRRHKFVGLAKRVLPTNSCGGR